MMKLEEMKYFIEIADSGSINQASKTLFIAQPALSRMISSLENELGFKLLERSKNGVRLTNEGKKVYTDCKQILALYLECSNHWEQIAYKSNIQASPLTISLFALPMMCNNTMNQVILDITHQYPRIRLKLFEHQLPDILDTALKHQPSIILSHYNIQTKDEVYTFARTHDMKVIPLFDDEYCLFAKRDNPLTQQLISDNNLRKFILLTYSYHNAEDEQVPSLKAYGLPDIKKFFDRTILLSNLHEMLQLTATTDAVTVTANRLIQSSSLIKSGQIVPLQYKLPLLPITYFILTSQTPTLEEKIVLQTIIKHFSQLAQFPLH